MGLKSPCGAVHNSRQGVPFSVGRAQGAEGQQGAQQNDDGYAA